MADTLPPPPPEDLTAWDRLATAREAAEARAARAEATVAAWRPVVEALRRLDDVRWGKPAAILDALDDLWSSLRDLERTEASGRAGEVPHAS